MTASTENPTDDARHIVWDHGRRTLCGQEVTGDPGDFYLPLGEAPATDIGGEWCWSCLQLQAEARAVLAAPVVPERGQDGQIIAEIRRAEDVKRGDEVWRGRGWATVLANAERFESFGQGPLVRVAFENEPAKGASYSLDEPFLIRAGVARVVPARPLDDTDPKEQR